MTPCGTNSSQDRFPSPFIRSQQSIQYPSNYTLVGYYLQMTPLGERREASFLEFQNRPVSARHAYINRRSWALQHLRSTKKHRSLNTLWCISTLSLFFSLPFCVLHTVFLDFIIENDFLFNHICFLYYLKGNCTKTLRSEVAKKF